MLLGCGPSVRRDLGGVRLTAVTWNDMCGLQDYFDRRVAARTPRLRALHEMSTETSQMERDERGTLRPITLGEGTYVLATRADRARFRQLLRDEYSRVPALAMTRHEQTVEVKVTWWQSGGIRHLRAEGSVEVTVDGASHEFPPHPCVGEFLFGEGAYAMRRCFQDAERARDAGLVPEACPANPANPATTADADADAATPAAADAADAAVDATNPPLG